MTLDPATANNDKGVALLNSGDYEGAVAAFSRAIELNPDFVTFYRNRSQALRRLGRMAEAASDRRAILRRSRRPGDRSDPNPNRDSEEPDDWGPLAGLLNLLPGFGLGYLVSHRHTQFKISIATWFLLSLFGIFIEWTIAGLPPPPFSLGILLLYVGIPALISWSLVAVITGSQLLIASMTRDWEAKGA